MSDAPSPGALRSNQPQHTFDDLTTPVFRLSSFLNVVNCSPVNPKFVSPFANRADAARLSSIVLGGVADVLTNWLKRGNYEAGQAMLFETK